MDGLAKIEAWFQQRGWTPFAFQRETWTAYLAGHSGLVHAPTGVGKTLAVWLGPVIEALNERGDAPASPGASGMADLPEHRLPAGNCPAAGARPPRANCRPPGARPPASRRRTASIRNAAEPLRVLWLTPLRALARDTIEALREPVAALGLPWTIEKRTADTTQTLRRQQRERLPTALVTTPESLSVLLSYPDTRDKLATLRCVVVDEWHELLGTKRGVQTELTLARLRRWLPGLRTWGLSATLGNLEQARDVLLGSGAPPPAPASIAAPADAGRGRPRQAPPPRLVQADLSKRFAVDTIIPAQLDRFPWAGHLGTSLVEPVAEAIERARTTLLFTNTRSQAELWFRALLRLRPDWIGRVALHHGSLDRDLRARVEALLKEGKLRAVVCTSSLDLGVDFSPVDQVVQLGSPKGIARLLQRAGRSGHSPGALSRVLCVPAHAFELVEFAAARDALLHRRVEARPPLERPMDVLAQHAVTVALGGGFHPDELHDEVRTTYAYRELTREQWSWVLDFIRRGGPSLTAYPRFARAVPDETGRYRVASARLGLMHRMSIGTITGEPAVIVKMRNGRRIGTIEESFISRLAPGDTFVFAGRVLELLGLHEGNAYVRRATRRSGAVPRWNGGRFPLSTQLAAAVREKIARGLEPSTVATAAGSPCLEMRAIRPLLELQARWSRIPRPDEVLIEHTRTRAGRHWAVFPFEGRAVHEGLCALLAHRLTRQRATTVNVTANDYGFELLGDESLELDEPGWRRLFGLDGLLDDLLACVNHTQMTRRAFRDIARVAGLILQGYPGQPRRHREVQASSDMFFDVFLDFDPDNLLLDQARREVLENQLELVRLRTALERIATQRLTIVHTPQLTPLAFPLNAERLRAEHVTSERWADRIRRMAAQLERAADGQPAPHAQTTRRARAATASRNGQPAARRGRAARPRAVADRARGRTGGPGGA